jgi:hypothetical protein
MQQIRWRWGDIMACNKWLLTGLTATVDVALGVSVALLGAAMVANGSFWGALGSPFLIGGAAAAGATAAAALVAMRAEIMKNCMQCAKEANELLFVVNHLIGLVSGYSVALGICLLTAAIPWAGLVGMTVAMVLLLVIVIGIPDLAHRFIVLGDCDVPVTTGQRVIVIVATAIFIITIALYANGVGDHPGGPRPGEDVPLN